MENCQNRAKNLGNKAEFCAHCNLEQNKLLKMFGAMWSFWP